MNTSPRPNNVVDLLAAQVERVPHHAALSWVSDGGMETLTWTQYRDLILDAAAGLLGMGVRSGDTVAILAPNVVEHYVGDIAALHCGAATVSLYPTLVHEQLAHILGDASPAVVIVIDDAAAARVERALPSGSGARIVVIRPDGGESGPRRSWRRLLADGRAHLHTVRPEIARRVADRGGADPAVYVYTSGTTGMPKGVILTHENLLFQIDAFDRMGFFLGGYRTISYLPLAHVAERLWSLYFPLANGGNVLLCPAASDLEACLRIQHPTFFMGVPRIWEKLRDSARRLLAEERYAARAAEVEGDRRTLLELWNRQQNGSLSSVDQVRGMRAGEGVLADLRRELGLDWTINPGSGAAALSDDLRDFWASLGVPLINGYGLSETTAVAVWERVGGSARGSSGFAVPGCEVRIADDGEILVRSPGNTPGYRNIDNAASGLYVDGWLATGDIGHLDGAGRLYVTDRKKEIIVNAAGKNIAPTAIEEKVAGRGIIGQAVAVGDDRPYVVSVMTVDPVALAAFASERGIDGDAAQLVQHAEVIAEAQRIVDAGNERLSRPEQIKRFALVADRWSVETEELTPTLKLRRRVVAARYADLIESIYAAPATHAVPVVAASNGA